MAGARAAAASSSPSSGSSSASSSSSSSSSPPQEPGLAELLEEFSRTQYRAKDGGSGAGNAKVERIEKRCLELFGRDYCYSVIQNVNGEICGHYPRYIVFLEYESSEKEKDTFESTVQVSRLQDLVSRSKMARCRGRFVCPVILYKGKHICRSATLAGWGELYGRTGYNYIFSGGSDDAWADSEDITEDDCTLRSADNQLFDKVRGHDIKLLRYLSVRYICDLMVENKKVKFGLNVTSSEKVDKAQRYADFTLLSIPYPGCEFFKEYKDRDYTAEGLVFNWKQDYVDAPLSIPVTLTRSLNIDWSEYQIFFFCFSFLKHITSEEFSALKSQRRKSLPARDTGFTVDDLCIMKRRDRGSTTSLSSDFSLVTESSPGATGSFPYEPVDPNSAAAQTQAAWRKSHTSSPQTVPWNRPQQSEDRQPSYQGIVEAKFSSSSSSNHSDNFFRTGSSPLEVPKTRSEDHSLPGSSISTDYGSWQMVTGCGSIQERAVLTTDSSLPFSFSDELPNSCLFTAPTERESRLEEVRSTFLATYSSTVGLKSVTPSPSGAIGGLLEQFARGVGLRVSSSTL
ncbi:myotubularin-related protein 14 isoform X5 [Petaurus breviceps papuanus]|uniref:myotubularin-related protein 14 isoform X5 n=1 Tax=Petaurus breviceps papuanus TaxID=3040969 RepID=UPI0036DBD0C9